MPPIAGETRRRSRRSDTPMEVIDTTSLTSAKPFEITPAIPATGTDGALAALEATSASFTEGLAERARQREQAFTQSQDMFLQNLLNNQGEASLTDAAYRDTVDPAEAELRDINQQMLEEQQSLRRRIEALDKNPRGLFGGALEQERQRIKDESLTRQADLAVIQLAKQGRFDSAKAIADRTVAAKLEQQRNLTEALRFNYENNKDLFTTAEQRSFETMLTDRNRKLDMDARKEMARFEQAIRQSDPLYQAQLANARSAGARGGTLNGKPQTATQAQVQGYADRTAQSDVVLSRLGDQFASKSVGNLIGSINPINLLKGGERQQFEQAQRNFVNAVLRRESGAVISKEEFDNAATQYFPKPGDTPETIAQKAANRQTVINNLYQQSNVERPAMPGQIIQDEEGNTYRVELDGETLTPL